MSAWALIGGYQFARPLLHWLILEGKDVIAPHLKELLADPTGTLSRVGDLIVWKGAGGQRILAGLESIGEQAARIDQAVAGIETTQLAMQGTLGVIQGVSLATLGVTSLSATYMAFRLSALNRRLQHLSTRINDIEGQIDAANKAHLRSSLQFLGDHERTGKDAALERALEDARRAVNIYGQLTQDEALGAKRLSVLNYRSRCYLLGLLAEIECQILREEDASALERIEGEQERLRVVAATVFSETIAKAPEAFLDPSLQAEGVTIELLADAYRQAHVAGALREVDIKDAAEMFEYARRKIYQRKSGLWWVWKPAGKAKQRYLTKLRYLLACVEDTNRIEALRLLICEAKERNTSLKSLVDQVKTWREQFKLPAGRDQPSEVLAYSFAGRA